MAASFGDDRIRCFAVGVRFRETVTQIRSNAEHLTHAMGSSERRERVKVLKTQTDNLLELFETARRCGIEWNGDLGGEVSSFQNQSVNYQVDPTEPLDLLRRVDELAQTLHEDAVYALVEDPGPFPRV